MTLGRNEVTIDYGGANEVTIEVIPFNWPRSDWENLILTGDSSTGWRDLIDSAISKLKALYNGAHGSTERGLKGTIVQYVEGTGHSPFVVLDWRGNSGLFAFSPDNGMAFEEIHGAAGDGISRFTATLIFVRVSVGVKMSGGIASAQAFGSHTVTGGA